MLKRTIATSLWFLAGWTIASFTAFVLGLDAAAAPLVGILAAAFAALDPLHLFWPSGLTALQPSGTADSIASAVTALRSESPRKAA